MSQKVRVALKRIEVSSSYEDSSALELYGTVDVQDEDNTLWPLFDRSTGEAVHIFAGDSWPQGGASEIASWIIPMVPQPSHSFTLVIDLWENDGGGNDPLFVGTLPRPFEDGWRASEWAVPFAQAHQKGNLVFELAPVP